MSNNTKTAEAAAAEKVAGTAQAAADAAADAAAAAAAAPTVPAPRHVRKKYFGAGVVAGIAAGIGGVLAWQRWGASA